jgi:hypothetical protein
LGQKVCLLYLGSPLESIAEEFKESIDGPNGMNFGLGAWMKPARRSTMNWQGIRHTPESYEAT